MGAFGREHGHVSFLEQGLGCGAVLGCQCNADAGIDAQAHALQLKRLSQDFANAFRHLDGRSSIDRCGEHQSKLVAAEACERSAGSHGIGETWAQLAQDIVADVVAKAVVDLLESVEIDHQHGSRGFGLGFEASGKALEEKPSVRQAGQLVGSGLSPAVRERAQLPKRIGGSGDGDQERGDGKDHAERD